MVKWRKNQWLPLVRKSQLCHVWEFDVAPSYSPRDGKLKAEFEQADRREQTGVSQVDIMTDFNLLLLVARLSLLPLKKKEEKNSSKTSGGDLSVRGEFLLNDSSNRLRSCCVGDPVSNSLISY